MAEPSWPDAVELSAYLTDVQTGQLKLRVPAPVVVLTAQLMQSVPRRVGLKNASELVAALLVQAAAEAQPLTDAIEAYRETYVHDILATNNAEGSFSLPARNELELT